MESKNQVLFEPKKRIIYPIVTRNNLPVVQVDLKTSIILSNELVEAIYRLRDIEQRLLFGLMCQLDPNAESFESITVKISEMAKLCGLTEKNCYSQISDACDRLIHQAVILKDRTNNGTRESIRLSWFARIDTKEGPGLLTYRFHEELIPYLIQLNKLRYGYVSYECEIISKLGTFFALRLFMLLVQHRHFGHRKFFILDIIKMFLLEKNYLRKDRNQFNVKKMLERIIYPAVQTINENTLMYVEEPELLKNGRQYVGIDFTFKFKDDDKLDNNSVKTITTEGKNINKKHKLPEWHTSDEVAYIYNRLLERGFSSNFLPDVLKMFKNIDSFKIAVDAAISDFDKGKGIKYPGNYLYKRIQQYSKVPPIPSHLCQSESDMKIDPEWVIRNASTWEEILEYLKKIKYAEPALDFFKQACDLRTDLFLEYKKQYDATHEYKSYNSVEEEYLIMMTKPPKS